MMEDSVDSSQRKLWDRACGALREAGWVLLMFGVSRLLIIGIVLFSKAVLMPGTWGDHTDQAAAAAGTAFGRPVPAGHIMRVFTQWDGVWYRTIAEHGYTSTASPKSDATFNPAFFPFYPILIRAASFIVRDFRISSLVISNVSFLIAALLLSRLVRLDYENPFVRRAAVTFLMFSPVSFFFSSAYTESTFLLLAVGAFYAARKQQWLIACLCGACLSATRSVGFLIVIPLFVEYVSRSWKERAALKTLFHPRVLLFGLIPLGLGLFSLYCYRTFGDPLAFAHATSGGWDRNFSSPWRSFINTQRFALFYRFLFEGLPVAGIALVAAGFYFKVRFSYLLFAILSILFAISWSSLEAMPRYLSVVFPLFIILALLTARFRWAYELLFAASVALLALCTALASASYLMT